MSAVINRFVFKLEGQRQGAQGSLGLENQAGLEYLCGTGYLRKCLPQLTNEEPRAPERQDNTSKVMSLISDRLDAPWLLDWILL